MPQNESSESKPSTGIYFRLLKNSVFSLRGGHVRIEWSTPIDEDEVPLVLAWMELVRKQISREYPGDTRYADAPK